jgi:hypothetical protein
MNRHEATPRGIVLAIAALSTGAAAPSGWAADEEEAPFSKAQLYFELNDTDGDLGIHAAIDGDAWKRLEIESPSERRLLDIRVLGALRKQGLTEISFESAEPPFDELAPAEFFARFPEGEYEIEGMTLEGEELESTVTISHVLPAPAGNITIGGEASAENCDAPSLPTVGAEDLVIDWDPVTTSHPTIGKAGPVEVAEYQLFVELLEQDNIKWSVVLPPSVTQFEVPEGFLALGGELKFEILTRATNGNQTAIESCFNGED